MIDSAAWFVCLFFDGGIKIGSLYEAFADTTLMFGLFPADNKPVEASTVRWLCYFAAGLVLTAAGLMITQIICIANNDVGMINTIKYVFGYSLVVIGTIGGEVPFWSNCMSRFISKISLEIYLAHMMVFRVVEKLGITRIAGVLLFAVVYQWIEEKIKHRPEENRS